MPEVSDSPGDVEATTPTLSCSDRLLARMRLIPCAGIFLGGLSGIFFATAGFIVKMIPGVHPIEIVVSRSIVQLIVYTPIIVASGTSVFGIKGERFPLFCRGFFGFVAFSLGYYSYRLISLADASTIIFSAPVYVSIFACVLLKEPCGLFQALNIIMTIVGVMLISKPTFLFGDHESVKVVEYRLEGSILALVSSFCAAFTFVMIRKLQKTPAAVVIFAFSITSVICGLVVLLVLGFAVEQHIRSPLVFTSTEWLFLLGNGLCGVFGQLFLTVALKIEEAGLVSLARTIDIVMAFLFQAAFLHEEAIHWTSILGAVIVSFGVGISAVRKWLRARPDALPYLRRNPKVKVEPIEQQPVEAGHVAVRVERKISNKLPVGSYLGLRDERE